MENPKVTQLLTAYIVTITSIIPTTSSREKLLTYQVMCIILGLLIVSYELLIHTKALALVVLSLAFFKKLRTSYIILHSLHVKYNRHYCIVHTYLLYYYYNLFMQITEGNVTT